MLAPAWGPPWLPWGAIALIVALLCFCVYLDVRHARQMRRVREREQAQNDMLRREANVLPPEAVKDTYGWPEPVDGWIIGGTATEPALKRVWAFCKVDGHDNETRAVQRWIVVDEKVNRLWQSEVAIAPKFPTLPENMVFRTEDAARAALMAELDQQQQRIERLRAALVP